MKHWVARARPARRGRAWAAFAFVLLCGLTQTALAEQGERPFWRGNKDLREQRQQLREERRQQRQEQFGERGEEVRRLQRERDDGAHQGQALNRDEAQKRFPRLGKRFDQIDGNRDGMITRDEVRAFRDARAKARVWAGEGDDPRD